MNPILSGSFSFRGLCTAMPCRLRREPLRAGAAFMRVNSLTSLLRKRCLLRTPSSPPQLKKTNPILSGSFSFRGLCAAMPCRLRREPLRAGAAFMRVNSLTSLLRKRCLLRTPSSPPQLKKTNPILSGSFSFRGLCAAMPCRLRREPLRADRKRREKQALAFEEIERSGHSQRLCDLSHECVALLLATNR